HADRTSRLVANRRERERAVETVLAPVTGHDDPAAANDERRVAREHLADLCADRVPDLATNLVGRTAELAAVPEKLRAGVVVEMDEVVAPPDESRRGAREHQADRDLEAFGPAIDRAESRRRPIFRPHEPARRSGAVEQSAAGCFGLDCGDSSRATERRGSTGSLVHCGSGVEPTSRHAK